VTEWLAFFRRRVTVLNELSMLQMREFMLDSEPRAYRAGEIVFERNDPGASLFAIADGSLIVEIDPTKPGQGVPLPQGSIVGEVGLISGRKRSATVRTASGSIVIEIPRNAALKLIATNSAAKREITRIVTERMLLGIVGEASPDDLKELLETAEIQEIRAGQAVITEGEEGYDVFIIRQGSMTVEKTIGGKPIFLRYLPAGSYVGEMALIDGGRRTATVRAAIKSEVIKLKGDAFRTLLAAKPALLEKLKKEMRARKDLTDRIEARKEGYDGAVQYYTEMAGFLVSEGLGEATDVLLIDEKLCIGCTIASGPAPTRTKACRASTARRDAPTPTSTCRPAAGTASIRTAWPIARPMRSTAARTARCSSTTPASAAATASATAPMASSAWPSRRPRSRGCCAGCSSDPAPGPARPTRNGPRRG
jgi:CRP-like cAMP-binding protein